MESAMFLTFFDFVDSCVEDGATRTEKVNVHDPLRDGLLP